MKRITLSLALLLGGTAVAHANPPGATPPAAPMAPYGVDAPQFDGAGRGPRGAMARGPRAGHPGERGRRAGKHRLPPRLRARLVAMFDRDRDGRLEGPERREARQFVKQLRERRGAGGAGARGPRGGGRRGAMGAGVMAPGGRRF